jgi:IclR family mhp operon transcriptional activator
MVRALSRGLAVLRTLEAGRPTSLEALHAATGLTKPTLLRLLVTLEAEGYVRRLLADGLWRCTSRSEDPTTSRRERLLTHAKPVLRVLCRDVRWPSDVAICNEGRMEVIESSRALSPLRFDGLLVGLRIPMTTSGLGRAWLTWSARTDRAIIQEKLADESSELEVNQAIYETRRDGYGRRVRSLLTRNSRRDGDMGIAVPIGIDNDLLGCISLVWRSTAMDERSFVRTHLERLHAAAHEIASRESGGL